MKTIFTLLLICSLFTVQSFAQHKPPTVPEFAVDGARWYYKNVGKNSNVVKHIYVERRGYAFVEALNPKTWKHEKYATYRLVFHYLNNDSVAVEYDTLLVRSDSSGVKWYHKGYRQFIGLYAGLPYGFRDREIISEHPFDGELEYYDMVRNFRQKIVFAAGAKINDHVLGYYNLNFAKCDNYPLGFDIYERIGSTYYMLRMDSCKKDSYGGPLIWYYDPEIGLYEHGKTKVEKDTMIPNSIENELFAHNSIKIYPSPFASSLNFENATNSVSLIYIYTLDGKCFYSEKLHAKENRNINTETWPAGLFIVKQLTEDKIYTGKIIKQ